MMATATPLPDWLTPDLIDELLFTDFVETVVIPNDPENLASTDGTTKQSQTRRTKNQNQTLQLTATALVKEVDATVSLSEFGNTTLQQWIDTYSSKDSLARKYRNVCCETSKFFQQDLGTYQSSKLLLRVVQKICAPTTKGADPVGGEITTYENDTLEYMGGYTLKKAKARFPSQIVESLCIERPSGALIPLLERKVGALHYPSEEYMLFLQHIYLKFAKEASSIPDEICFNKAVDEVLNGQYFQNFASRIRNLCEDEAEDKVVQQFLVYITNLVVRVLSYCFARKLFTRIHQNVTKFSQGVRGDLRGLLGL